MRFNILRGDSLDPEREKQLLGNPSDWFGPVDAELMHWNDERMRPASEHVRQLVEQGHLFWENTPLVEPASFNVPEEWKE